MEETPSPTALYRDSTKPELDSKQPKKSRANLHASWTKYFEERIKRWKAFGADFAQQDKDSEEKVTAARAALQSARENLDKIKERLAKQDEAALKEAEVISDAEGEDDDMKVETSERIQEGINTILANLESVQVRLTKEEEELEAAPKKQRVDTGGQASGGAGSPMLQPFAAARLTHDVMASCSWSSSRGSINPFKGGCH